MPNTIFNPFKHDICYSNHFDQRCPFCNCEVENLGHLLFSCTKVVDIWFLCYVYINVTSALPFDSSMHFCQHCILYGSNFSNRKWRYVWCVIVWVLWNSRSKIIFHGKTFNKEQILNDIMFHC